MKSFTKRMIWFFGYGLLDNFVELYEFIWNCKELDYLVESQEYPKSSLKQHLLLTVQLALG